MTMLRVRVEIVSSWFRVVYYEEVEYITREGRGGLNVALGISEKTNPGYSDILWDHSPDLVRELR
jgi:hypothetical protein